MGDHVHCISCFNQRCTVRPEPGISCDLMTCPQVCGAVFHSCKVVEHKHLCQLMKVPCLNSGYGCPATLTRNQMYAHLEVCPAGVVCCTMEWNRWPVNCLDYTSYESLSRGVEEAEQLDMMLALQDQQTLLESLKLIAMSPSAQGESQVSVSKENKSKASALDSPQPHPACSAKEKIASGINGLNEDHFSKLYEATVETARSLAAALDFVSNASCGERSPGGVKSEPCSNTDIHSQTKDTALKMTRDLQEKDSQRQSYCSNCLTENGSPPQTNAGNQNTNGPCLGETEERSRETGDPQGLEEFQLIPPLHVSQGASQRAGHVVLEGRGLGFLESAGSDRTFHNKQFFRGHGQFLLPNGRLAITQDRLLYRSQAPVEDKGVDTSDLEQDEDPMGLGEIDLITAALLFCLEESRECRRISDTVYVDGYRVDFGTQTFSFPAAILVTNTRVGDMASASACDHAAPQHTYPRLFRTLRLGLGLEALKVEAILHNHYFPSNPRYQTMFPFVCGQSFRRDQFSSHFRNVHGDIYAGLNGWMEHRCPLAYYGCTFSQRRFYPSCQGAKVVHDRQLKAFGVQPHVDVQLCSDLPADQLSRLPIEILWHIAGFLDSFSLCQLSLVSRMMREVCGSLLQSRGIVELQWEQRPCPGGHGTVSWQIKNKVWRFSTAFSPVSSWGFTDIPSMSTHLKKCHFNIVEQKTEPVPLPAMCTARDGLSLRRVLRHVNT